MATSRLGVGVLTIAAVVTTVIGVPHARQRGAMPQFRTGVDLVTLDVSVLDRNRLPVKNLTAADFAIKEDGKLQKVQAFAAVDLPDVVVPTAAWIRDVAPDVQSNQVDDRRLVVLVIDNWSGPEETWESRTGKRVAKEIISKLGPADMTAVIVLYGSRFSQDFTNDPALLLAAIEQKQAVLDPSRIPGGAVLRADFVKTMKDVADYLLDLPDRRKAIIYVGKGSAPSHYDLVDLIATARRANVNIYCFDTNGLRSQEMNPFDRYGAAVLDPGREMRELMLTISGETGGDATVSTNRPTDGVPQIFVENGSYYLLGYVSTNSKSDGKLRRIDVKVNRSSVDVRFRRGYYAPPDPIVAARTPAPPVVQNAIAGLLPNRAVTMEAALDPFLVPGRREAAVAVAVGLRTAAADGRTTDVVEVLTRAFTEIGDPRGEQLQRMRVTSGAAAGATFDVLTQMALAPGRYEFRLSARDLSLDRVGSVYAHVEVPDFAREPISLSGVVVADETTLGGPRDALAAIVPIVPTTQRTFAAPARVTAFLRVYQGGRTALAPATVTVRVMNDADRVVVDRPEAIDAARFDAATRALDYRFDLPLAGLAPGAYLLTIAAALDAQRTATRHVRFTVR